MKYHYDTYGRLFSPKILFFLPGFFFFEELPHRSAKGWVRSTCGVHPAVGVQQVLRNF